jgi:phage terminase large subunit-like protein
VLRRADVVTVGIDGGGLDDLLGLSVIGRDAITRDWLLWSRAWAHPTVLERRKSEAARMQDFARDGDLRIVARLGDDVEEVADLVADIDRAGLLHAVGLDPVGIGGIVDALAERHITGDRVVGIPQGWRISGAIKTLERKLGDTTVWHPGQAMMAWCVGNARLEPRGNAITITEQAAGKAKIDPLVAAFNAAELMSRNPEARSVPAVFVL